MSRSRRCVRLLIADDERLFREALRVLLESEPGFQVVGYAADGTEAIALARRLKPDVLLLDLAMPRLPGLEALRSITAGAAPVRTLVLTGSITPSDTLTALMNGARGIIKKDAPSELLFKSIRAVMNGQYWIGREAVSDLVAALRESRPQERAERPQRPFKLTRRELEIIQAIVNGQSNKEIGAGLGVAETTVKHHLTRIFDKLGVSTRLELVLFAMNNGLF
jgi:DNA-binding NarL/FixJ family response regulator